MELMLNHAVVQVIRFRDTCNFCIYTKHKPDNYASKAAQLLQFLGIMMLICKICCLV